MANLAIWTFLVLLTCYSVHRCSAKYSSVPLVNDSITSAKKKSPHIHNHNGDLSSVRSSNIIKEEGRYFLRQLFKEYGTGREMDIVSLEAFLQNLGYAAETHVYESKDGRGVTDGVDVGEIRGVGHQHQNQEGKHNGEEGKHGGVEGKHDDEDPGVVVDDGNCTKEGDEIKINVGLHGDHEGNHNKRRNRDGNGGEDDPNGSNPVEVGDVRASEGEGDARADGRSHDSDGNDKMRLKDDGEIGRGEKNVGIRGDGTVQERKGDQGGGKKQDHQNGKHDKHRHGKKGNHREEMTQELGENSGTASSDAIGGRPAKGDGGAGGHPGSDGQDDLGGTLDRETIDEENGEHGKHSHKKTKHGRHKQRKGVSTEGSNAKGSKRQKNSDGPVESGTSRRERRSTDSVTFHSHDAHNNCMTAEQLIKVFHFDEQRKITQTDFLYISPAIVYQLTKPQCRPSRFRNPEHLHPPSNNTVSTDISARVWGYSAVAILVISLVGLLGVAVIPIMQRVFYNQLLQFLVSLAVGALTGDAMLHLLPHAIAGKEKDPVGFDEDFGGSESGQEHGHNSAIWKGLCGLMGIYFFFIIQRLLTIVTGVRNKRRHKKALRLTKKALTEDVLSSGDEDEMVLNVSIPAADRKDIEQSHPLNSEKGESGHASGHGHSHDSGPLPTSVSAMAWMVILGDGIHNFSDGLAIGAAFANSITGGFSTSIAVFCHELPHEIGDFAVLIKSGMSIKQAIMYNIVSSVLCLVGMLIGVALGNIGDASIWIFAAVGGMFIYISLVTMVPELTSVISDKPLRDLALQCAGIGTGAGIMLLIAIYEDDLKTSLG